MKEPAYKEVTPEELKAMHKAMRETAGGTTTGPEKLDPQVAELLKAVEGELGALRKRVLELEIFAGPFQQLAEQMFHEKLDKKLGRKNQFVDAAKACEASPMQQFKYKYNV